MELLVIAAIAVAAVLILGLLCAIFGIGNSSDSGGPDMEELLPRDTNIHCFSFKELHEMNQKYLHRNDKKHARHKQNQTPW